MKRFREFVRSDAGIGMVLVLGIAVFVAGLTATAGVVVMNGLAQTRQRIGFEQSLAAAEAGIDYALGHLQAAFDEGPSDFPIPAPGVAPVEGCALTAEQMPDWSDEDDPAAAEQAWAAAWLDAASGTAEGRACMIQTPTGHVLVLKPATPQGSTLQYGRVYARGYSPSIDDIHAQQRTLKVEYVFLPYKPKFAILTGTKLELQSTSTDVTGAHGTDPTLAAVHTNGTLEVTGSPTVTGPVSVSVASDSQTSSNFSANPGGVPIVRPIVPIPHVSARQFYSQAPSQDAAAMEHWADLCPDGSVRAYSSGGPCTATTVLGASPYQGWAYSGSTHTWTASKDTESGTYFVHQADVANGTGNGSIPNVTVIASATSTTCGAKQYGNIVWDHYDTVAPAFKNLFFLADGDLKATSNFYSGQSAAGRATVSGMYVAAEEVLVWTSSSGLVGSVLAANQCPSDTGPVATNEVQGQVVKFDPNGDSPFSSLIATTLWLEYAR